MILDKSLNNLKLKLQNFCKLSNNSNSVVGFQSKEQVFGKKLEVVWVVGNEASDLDSLVSSIALSLFKSYDNYQLDAFSQSLTIPLINLPSSELALRPEATYLLSLLKINPSSLLFIDDPLIQNNFLPKQSCFKQSTILVDHNRIHSNLKQFDSKVTSIYDHHVDELYHLDAKPRVLEMVGSCSSLIAKFILESKNNELFNRDYLPQLAKLLLAPILVDTANLSGSYGVVTDLDRTMANSLAPFAFPVNSDFQSCLNSYFKQLDSAKMDISHLTTTQLLLKDFKLFPTLNYQLGMSTIINFSISELITRDSETLANPDQFLDLSQALNNFTTSVKSNLHVQVILSSKATKETGFNRQMILYTKNMALLAYLDQHLLKDPVLMLKSYPNPYSEGWPSLNLKFYDQTNPKATRKQSYPILKSLLEVYQG